jgi:hypothetical protein
MVIPAPYVDAAGRNVSPNDLMFETLHMADDEIEILISRNKYD